MEGAARPVRELDHRAADIICLVRLKPDRVAAATAAASILFLCAADWPTDGGSPQRTDWQKDETTSPRKTSAGFRCCGS